MEVADVLRAGASHLGGGPGRRLLPGLSDPPQVSTSRRGSLQTNGLSFSTEELDLIPSIPGRFHKPRRQSVLSVSSEGSPRFHVTRSRGGGVWASEPWQRDRVTVRAGALPRTLPPMGMEGTERPEPQVAGVHRRNMATALFMAVASSRYSKVCLRVIVIMCPLFLALVNN